MAQDPICGMTVKEKQAFTLTYDHKAYFFCSSHCLEKFKKEKGIPESALSSCAIPPAAPFYKNKVFIVASILIALSLLSFIVPSFEPFRNSLVMYFKTIWWAILFGLFIGGLIDYYIPREYISLILSKPKKRTILSAVMLGFFMSACSHGILALSIQLHKKGASTPAVVAFLLASPWANMALTFMLLAFFGIKAFFMIVGAVIIALNTGFIFQFLETKNLIERNKNSLEVKEDFSIKADIKKRFREYRFSRTSLIGDIKGIYSGMASLANMVLWWILIGMGIASAAGAYIPSNIFHSYMGPTMAGLFITLAVATVIEVCSEGSAPMAFEIFRQTGAFGNSFVFLMAGVATDYTEIGLLWHNVGKKTALWFPLITVPQIIILGILANALF